MLNITQLERVSWEACPFCFSQNKTFFFNFLQKYLCITDIVFNFAANNKTKVFYL